MIFEEKQPTLFELGFLLFIWSFETSFSLAQYCFILLTHHMTKYIFLYVSTNEVYIHINESDSSY